MKNELLIKNLITGEVNKVATFKAKGDLNLVTRLLNEQLIKTNNTLLVYISQIK